VTVDTDWKASVVEDGGKMETHFKDLSWPADNTSVQVSAQNPK